MNHFDLSASESVFGLSQDPPMYAYASHSQDHLLWGGTPLFDLQGTF